LKRRNSITLGVAARKNLLSSGPDNMYPNPGKKPDPGGIQKVYMNDADWEEYKRKHDEKNGLVTISSSGVLKWAEANAQEWCSGFRRFGDEWSQEFMA
jgi:hypothetical protein